MLDIPHAIMINVPEAYFRDGGFPEKKEAAFRRYYETMGRQGREDECFHHWISGIPVHEKNILEAFVCFRGAIQYKARVVEFRRNHTERFRVWDDVHECYAIYIDGPRNWVITTGPVIPAPEFIPQKGFRGFRYVETIF